MKSESPLKQFALPAGLFAATVLLFLVTIGDPDPYGEVAPPTKNSIRYKDVKRLRQDSIQDLKIKQHGARVTQELEKQNSIQGMRQRNHAGGVDLQSEKNAGQIDTADNSHGHTITLDQKLDQFLAHRQSFEQMEKIKRREYVEEFKVRAKNMGYEVEVNDDLEIIKVKKIKKGSGAL